MEDALQGTWVFNDSLNISDDITWNVNYTTNSEDYTDLRISLQSSPMGSAPCMGTAAFPVLFYNMGAWDDRYKTIIIISKLSEVTNGDTLLAWLQANAEKQTPVPQLDAPQNVTASGTVVSFDPVQNATSYEIFADGVSIGTVDYVIKKLATPQNIQVIGGGTTVSWDAVENATSYEILVSGSSFGTVSTTSVDLSTLSGWSSLTDGNYSVTVVAKADGYADSEPSAAVSVEKAAQAQIWFDAEISITQGKGKDFYYLNDSSNWALVKLMYGGALLMLSKNGIESNLGLTLEESKIYWLHNDTQLGTGFSYTTASGQLPWLLDVHYLKVKYTETTNEVFIKFYDTAPTP